MDKVSAKKRLGLSQHSSMLSYIHIILLPSGTLPNASDFFDLGGIPIENTPIHILCLHLPNEGLLFDATTVTSIIASLSHAP